MSNIQLLYRHDHNNNSAESQSEVVKPPSRTTDALTNKKQKKPKKTTRKKKEEETGEGVGSADGSSKLHQQRKVPTTLDSTNDTGLIPEKAEEKGEGMVP